MRIEAWQSCEYLAVYRITEYRDGKIYRTENTGCYIGQAEEASLPDGYIGVSISAKPGDIIELKEHFNERGN